MDKTKLSDNFFRKFLDRELDLMRKLKPHPNVVTFYDVFENNILYYIVMEYAPHGDLFEYISKRHFIPESQSGIWFQQLINGVDHIHQTGFAHRDLKCENLLLDVNYNIKITDFGFCCHTKKKRRDRAKSPTPLCYKRTIAKDTYELLSQTFCGSVVYASPELLRAQPYCPILVNYSLFAFI